MQYAKVRNSMTRDTLHNLLDRIPEEELPAAQRFLEYLAVSPAYRAALSAAPDDDPVMLRKVTPLQSLGRTKKDNVLGGRPYGCCKR
jgi:hypothetical protein